MKLASIRTLALLVCTPAALANPAHNQIHAMTEPARQALMKNYLTSNGETCQNVDRTFFQGISSNGDAFWNVACRRGKSFVLMVHNDAKGSATLLDCAVLKAVKAKPCFVKFSPP